jgi:hypothetical protein
VKGVPMELNELKQNLFKACEDFIKGCEELGEENPEEQFEFVMEDFWDKFDEEKA